jgi:hypothetical protein
MSHQGPGRLPNVNTGQVTDTMAPGQRDSSGREWPSTGRRWQRFLDRHLHAARDPAGQWTDFPPRRLRELAALPAPLGPVVTAPE